jgi:hypothetical protein
MENINGKNLVKWKAPNRQRYLPTLRTLTTPFTESHFNW